MGRGPLTLRVKACVGGDRRATLSPALAPRGVQFVPSTGSAHSRGIEVKWLQTGSLELQDAGPVETALAEIALWLGQLRSVPKALSASSRRRPSWRLIVIATAFPDRFLEADGKQSRPPAG